MISRIGRLLVPCVVVAAVCALNVARARAQHVSPEIERRYLARYPQPAKVSHLVGLPVLDQRDSTIGYVERVVRGKDGRIQLIVPYAPWFGWAKAGLMDRFRRPVAVPLETVAILGRQIDVIEITRADFDKAPSWIADQVQQLAPDETVKIALGRR
jgi:hypothetical protein